MTETINKVRIVYYFSEKFEVRSGLKQGDSLSPVLFSLTLEYVIRKGLDRSGKISMLEFADDSVLLNEETETIKLNTTTL